MVKPASHPRSSPGNIQVLKSMCDSTSDSTRQDPPSLGLDLLSLAQGHFAEGVWALFGAVQVNLTGIWLSMLSTGLASDICDRTRSVLRADALQARVANTLEADVRKREGRKVQVLGLKPSLVSCHCP